MANQQTQKQTQIAKKAKARSTRASRGGSRAGLPSGTPTAEQAIARIATLFQAATAADQAEDLKLYKKDPELAAAMGIDPPVAASTDTQLQTVRLALQGAGLLGTQLDQAMILIAPAFAQQGSLSLNSLTQQIQQELGQGATAKDTRADAKNLLAESRDLALTALQFVMTRDASFDDLFTKLQDVLIGAAPGMQGYAMDDVLDESEPIPDMPPPIRMSLQALAQIGAREYPPPSKGNGSPPRSSPGAAPLASVVASDAQIEQTLSDYIDAALLAATAQDFEPAWAEVMAYANEVHALYKMAPVSVIKSLKATWRKPPSEKKELSDFRKTVQEARAAAVATFMKTLNS